MKDLMQKIRAAQVAAGERVVVESLRAQGLGAGAEAKEPKKPLGSMLIAYRPCGCVCGYSWDDEGEEALTARWALGMLRCNEGLSVRRIERFEGDPMPRSSCPVCIRHAVLGALPEGGAA